MSGRRARAFRLPARDDSVAHPDCEGSAEPGRLPVADVPFASGRDHRDAAGNGDRSCVGAQAFVQEGHYLRACLESGVARPVAYFLSEYGVGTPRKATRVAR